MASECRSLHQAQGQSRSFQLTPLGSNSVWDLVLFTAISPPPRLVPGTRGDSWICSLNVE